MKQNRKRSKILIALGVVVGVALLFIGYQKGMASSSLKAFERGDYKAAKNCADKVVIENWIEPYEEKIGAMYYIESSYNRWQNSRPTAEQLYIREGLAIAVIEECISYTFVVEKYGLEDSANAYVQDVGKWLLENGESESSIEKELLNRYEEKGMYSYYPIFKNTKSDDEIKKIIQNYARIAADT